MSLRTSFTGTWSTSGGPNPYGTNSLYSKSVGATYTFTVPLPRPGDCEVRVWWTGWPSRNSQVPIDVFHATGDSTFTVDQRSGGGQWNVLGIRPFNSKAVITIRSLGGGTTCADAVMLVPVAQ